MRSTNLTAAVACGALLFLCLPLAAQTATSNSDLEKRVRELQDRAALKELVDNFSILADKKDVHAQVQLFTADATLEPVVNGKSAGVLKGRDQMEHTFGPFLNTFQTVYHFNGQQTVTLDGDRASGISYCTVTLIATQNGKRVRTTMGVHYQDEFVRENGRWLIAKRMSIFDWQDRQDVNE